MPEIAYHASQEQFSPSQLLAFCKSARDAGFDAINSSDHFKPWSKTQGQSGYTLAWLGAAMQAIDLPFGMVCAPGYRHHPAVLAQAIATLTELFPGRLSVALGSGEAINESITGEKWPLKHERNERLRECEHLIKKLLKGEEVTHHGRVIVEKAKLYTLPEDPPLLLTAALTKETAAWAGSWSGGLLTAHKPYRELKELVHAFRAAGGEGKPVHLKVQLSYAETESKALEGAYDQWKYNIASPELLSDLSQVEQFEAAAAFVRPDDLKKTVHISSSLAELTDLIGQYRELDVDRIILHNVNRNQELFIERFGASVLPALR